MQFNLTKQLLIGNDCYKAALPLKPAGVMVHSVGVAQPDPQVFIRSWNKSGVNKCVHAFVGREGVVQTLPWTTRAWHAGTGTTGRSANNTHLSFECCEPAGHTYLGGTMIGYDVKANEAFFQDIYRNSVALTAMLCKQFGLDPLKPGVVICHREGYDLGIASGHADVLHWWPKHGVTMDQFRRDVAKAMSTGSIDDEEEDDMTQERFNELMEQYLSQRAKLNPASWSEQARKWAEQAGIVGTGSTQRYLSSATREEVVQMLYRMSQNLSKKD